MTTTGEAGPAGRPLRADARHNRERILEAARTVFAEQGASASLNKIAQQAQVGPGTLYRHFPTLPDLLVAIIGSDVDLLCARGRELLDHPSPAQALHAWLRAVAVHATAMRGLVAAQMAALSAGGAANALAACHDAIYGITASLLTRAQQDRGAPGDADPGDLLMLVNAIAWAAEQAPADRQLIDRLLALVTGLEGRPPAGGPSGLRLTTGPART